MHFKKDTRPTKTIKKAFLRDSADEERERERRKKRERPHPLSSTHENVP
jgi:hypothetical protein